MVPYAVYDVVCRATYSEVTGQAPLTLEWTSTCQGKYKRRRELAAILLCSQKAPQKADASRYS